MIAEAEKHQRRTQAGGGAAGRQSSWEAEQLGGGAAGRWASVAAGMFSTQGHEGRTGEEGASMRRGGRREESGRIQYVGSNENRVQNRLRGQSKRKMIGTAQ